ncbi:MAG: PAQR family membrane homeostasis protein TrhA [Phocaeicola sp.]
MAVKYTKGEEWANALSHGIGCLFGAAGGGYLMHIAYKAGDMWAVVGMALYIIGVVASYGASTFYHAWKPSATKAALRKCDHAAIYLHIAGSYSPILLVLFRQESPAWGWGLFALLWVCTIIGHIISYRGLKEHSNIKTLCFVAMGCSIFIPFKTFYEITPSPMLYSLLGEGVSYITGALFYSFHKYRYMHSIFHLFCLGGTFFHLLALAYMFIAMSYL